MSDNKGSSSSQGSGSNGKNKYESLIPAKKKIVSNMVYKTVAGRGNNNGKKKNESLLLPPKEHVSTKMGKYLVQSVASAINNKNNKINPKNDDDDDEAPSS
ncbi:hypothetical protein AgCh_008365 [Apium graveolens]